MKSERMLFASLTMALLLRPSVLFAELKMPAIFSDNMILQRDKPVPVWGWADAGAEITVEFGGQKKTVRADSTDNPPGHGAGQVKSPPSKSPVLVRWMVKLDPMPANCQPRTMTVTSSNSFLCLF